MINTPDTLFFAPDVSTRWMQSNGFHYNRIYSNAESSVYSYRFPAYKSNGRTTLDCEISIELGNPIVIVDVYEANTYHSYEPFYYHDYGNYDCILNKIWSNIESHLNAIGIKKGNIGNNHTKHKNKKCNKNK